MTYFNTVNMQPEMADNILLGVYRKMLQKQRDKEDRAYIRVEAREYQFSGGGAPVNESVGFEVTSAVCKFQKKLTRAAEVFR
jgi:uncharacterized protein (UPF0303 family)